MWDPGRLWEGAHLEVYKQKIGEEDYPAFIQTGTLVGQVFIDRKLAAMYLMAIYGEVGAGLLSP